MYVRPQYRANNNIRQLTSTKHISINVIGILAAAGSVSAACASEAMSIDS